MRVVLLMPATITSDSSCKCTSHLATVIVYASGWCVKLHISISYRRYCDGLSYIVYHVGYVVTLTCRSIIQDICLSMLYCFDTLVETYYAYWQCTLVQHKFMFVVIIVVSVYKTKAQKAWSALAPLLIVYYNECYARSDSDTLTIISYAYYYIAYLMLVDVSVHVIAHWCL